MLRRNWKTTLAGLGMLLTAAAQIVTALASGTMPDWEKVVPLVIAGLGLLLAKDYNVSGIGK